MTDRSRYLVPSTHAIIWGILMSIPYFLFRGSPDNTGLPEYYFWITNLYHIGLFYLNAFLLYPQLVNRKWWFVYPFAMAGVLILSYYLKRFGLAWFDRQFHLTQFNRRILFFPPIPFLIASIVYRIIINRIRSERLQRDRKAEQLQAEIMFLRSQISPHFLFNIITNLVALARQKSDLLETYLVRFSELLRYMLYSSNDDKFTVNREITYLENYIEIQKLRFSDNVDVQVNFNLDKKGGECAIEPMLLIPFVENAYKHGATTTERPYITIDLNVQGSALSFQVENNCKQGDSPGDKSTGIGVENVRTRLDLLYEGRHRLEIQNHEGIHCVRLDLQLSC